LPSEGLTRKGVLLSITYGERNQFSALFKLIPTPATKSFCTKSVPELDFIFDKEIYPS
jgi:hypothetical protein